MSPESAPGPVLSVLDLVPVSAGRTRAQALRDTLELARTADRAGYRRYWVGEHHGSVTYLSSATTVLMGQVLAATERIGASSAGIMLPNHAPLIVAEQVGTLAELYPGRVGVGIGRAPGTDAVTAAALRRRAADPQHFAEEILELLAYLGSVPDDAVATVPGSLIPAPEQGESGEPTRHVRAIPGEGTRPPVWVLGSSVNGARVAGSLGLPFVVASHFAPSQAGAAMTTYRSVFDAGAPTAPDGAPHLAAAVNVMVAPSREEASRLFTTSTLATARVLGGRPAPLDPPAEDPEGWRALVPGREQAVRTAMSLSFVGTGEDVAAGLRDLASRWDLEELLVVTTAHDPAARRRSYELLASAWSGRH